MKELLLYLAHKLVENPDAVRVEEEQQEDGTRLVLHVAPDDMGKVIGRQGRIAKSIRTLVRSCAPRGCGKVIVDIEEA